MHTFRTSTGVSIVIGMIIFINRNTGTTVMTTPPRQAENLKPKALIHGLFDVLETLGALIADGRVPINRVP